MRRFLFFLLLLSAFISCKRIIYKYHDFHAPELETINSISQFCNKYGIDTSGMRIISRDDILESFSKHNSQDLLFDKNGILVDYNVKFSNESCGQNIVSTITSIIPNSFLPRDSGKTIQKESLKWRFLSDTSKTLCVIPEDEDYILVTYWNTFSGKPNHFKRFAKLKQAMTANSSVKFKHIMVNQDFRVDMGYDLDAKIVTRQKKAKKNASQAGKKEVIK
jgi:hypothetical protein